MAPVLLLDVGDRVRCEDVPAEKAARDQSPMASRQRIDTRSRSHVCDPGQYEDEPRIHDSPSRQERAERHGDIRGDRREDIFDGGQYRDERVERSGGELLEIREKVRQETLSPRSVATAKTATPSPRPIQPIPSLVFAFTET